MSDENVELARRSIGAFNKTGHRGDASAPRARSRRRPFPASVGLEAGLYRGFDACLRVWESYFDVFEEIDIKPESYLDAGDSVVIPNTARTRGRDGIEAFTQATFVFTFSGGQLTHICLYQEKEQALKAVGLEG
jgi:hypothetical protein